MMGYYLIFRYLLLRICYNTLHHISLCLFDTSEKIETDNEVQKLVDESFFFENEDDCNDEDNEKGYEELFELEIPNYEVYVLIEDNVDLTNKIFLNNNGIEEDEDLEEL